MIIPNSLHTSNYQTYAKYRMSIRIYGNRELKTLPGLETRPTLAKVREALFNVWQGSIVDCRWLDLCSGSGGMGAEALCRGAKLVVGIENSIPACDLIEQNWGKVASTAQTYRLLRGDVVKKIALLAGQKFDLIYLDPPYAGNLYAPVLNAIEQFELLTLSGEIAVEHSPYSRISTLPDSLTTLELCRQKTYGKTALSFYQLKGTVASD
jgi:16S rRNA (guanine966-N2)-methyltransferase